MSASPLVSVLLTSYNRETFIAESIASVLAQTFCDFELIISDDASTDRSLEIARSFAQTDSRVRVTVNACNLGQFKNRHIAATLAQGRYLKFHDSDDVMYRHCLEAMVVPLDREQRAGFALSGNMHWTGGPCPMLLTPKLAFEREYLGTGLFQLGPAAALFRTEVYRELGGFPDEGVASDLLFWIHACSKVNVLLVPADLFYYRIHSGQEYARPDNTIPYAQARAAAWKMLNSPECPLDRDVLDRAKTNFLWAATRDAYRQFRRGRFTAAAATVRLLGLDVADWIRYLRPPNRDPNAGTPVES
jgi:glycosyltransferase involved in cell wall biosynthesis